MCLTIKCDPLQREEAQKPEIALKDIPCFKVLTRRLEDGELTSPFRSVPYEQGATYYAALSYSTYSAMNVVEVEAGLHSCVEYTSAAHIRDYLTNNWGIHDIDGKQLYEFVIYNAIIPAGSSYHKGTFEDYGDSYASTSLKLLEEVK